MKLLMLSHSAVGPECGTWRFQPTLLQHITGSCMFCGCDAQPRTWSTQVKFLRDANLYRCSCKSDKENMQLYLGSDQHSALQRDLGQRDVMSVQFLYNAATDKMTATSWMHPGGCKDLQGREQRTVCRGLVKLIFTFVCRPRWEDECIDVITHH